MLGGLEAVDHSMTSPAPIEAPVQRRVCRNMIRYDPFRELTQMQRHWLFHHNQNVDQVYGRGVEGEETQSAGSTWTPLVDVFEDGETITLKVELPEVDANDAGTEIDLTPSERAKIETILAGAAGRVKEFTPLRPAMEPWGEEIRPG